jgi:MEMO1 family protein
MQKSIREPAVAGSFYPAGRAELASLVDELLASGSGVANELASAHAGVRPKAIIAPHAGYAYSGPCAARGFALLAPLGGTIERAVVLGPAHRVFVEGIVWPGTDALKTPLGEVAIDRSALAGLSGVAADARAHAHEHSIEVELPFLQVVAPDAKVVPLAVGRATAEEVAAVLEKLWGGPETVIVVSSDLSHYLPYDVGRRLDEDTARRIVALDAPLDGDEACGATGINGLLRVARQKMLRAELVDLRSSGDAGVGAHVRASADDVVGYGAFAFYEPR